MPETRDVLVGDAEVKNCAGTAAARMNVGHMCVVVLDMAAALVLGCGDGSEEEAEEESGFH